MAFLCCTAFEEVTIPDSVTKIHADVFRGYESLRKVVISSISCLTGIYRVCTFKRQNGWSIRVFCTKHSAYLADYL